MKKNNKKENKSSKSCHCCVCGIDFCIEDSLKNSNQNDSCPHCGNTELMYIIDTFDFTNENT